jgi:hypothetical protein
LIQTVQQQTASQAAAELLLPSGLHLTEGQNNPITLGDMTPCVIKQADWEVLADDSVQGVLTYSVRVSSLDAQSLLADKTIEIPTGDPAEKKLVLKSGWPQTVDGYVRSSPACAKLGDESRAVLFQGTIDPLVGRPGLLYAWTAEGGPAFGSSGIAFQAGEAIISSPAIQDLNGDGYSEIVFGSDDGNLYVFTLTPEGFQDSGGSAILNWSRSLQAQDSALRSVTADPDDRDVRTSGTLRDYVGLGGQIYSTPAIGQLDDDGQLEIVVGAENGRLYAFNHDGTPLDGSWPVRLGGLIRSSAAIGDLDGDGRNEVVVGCFDRKVYAFDASGAPLPGWPVVTGGTITSSPALVNLDEDSETLEAVIGSSDGYLYGLNAEGQPAGPHWPVQVPGYESGIPNDVDSSPAAADFDGDGRHEIAVGSDGGYVHLISPDGQILWSRETGGEVFASPAIADLDGDGMLEILFGSDVAPARLWESDRVC